MVLTKAAREFILHWGEMGNRWGVNRTVAQVHALLYLSAEPLTAEDIAEALSVARSNVGTSLRELKTVSWCRRRIRWATVATSSLLPTMRGSSFSPWCSSAWSGRLSPPSPRLAGLPRKRARKSGPR